MSKALIIAEKPSVANDIARALGGFTKHDEYYESEDYVLSSAVGHLLEIAAPEEYEVKRGKWSFANLPVIPPHFDLNPIAKSESRLKVLTKLLKRKDVDRLINACDAGREGELIFRLIAQHAKAKQPVQRLWLQSMTAGSIRDGFANLRSDADMQPLADAARCRSEADWLVGINGTRAMTAFNSKGGGFFLTTVGRVQTPTLSIVVEREEKIRRFVPRDYWEVRAEFIAAKGMYDETGDSEHCGRPLGDFCFWLALATVLATAWEIRRHLSGTRRNFPKFESLPFNNRRSSEKLAHRESFAAGLLQLHKTQPALTTRNQDTLRAAFHNHACLGITRQFHRLGGPYLHDYAIERSGRTRKRIEGANLTREHARRTTPVQRRFVFGNLLRVRGAVLRLRRGGQGAVPLKIPQRFNDQIGAQLRHAVVQRGGGIGGRDRDVAFDDHRTGIETCIHLHQRDTRLAVSGFERTMNGRRAAPARQQRTVDIDCTQRRDVEHFLRQDQPVRSNNHDVVRRSLQQFDCSRRFFGILAIASQGGRLRHRQTVLDRESLHRTRCQFQTAPRRPVRLRQHKRHMEPRRMNGGQRDSGKFGCSSKYDTQRLSHRFSNLQIPASVLVNRRVTAPFRAFSSCREFASA